MNDTICAIATAQGVGAISIIRISGDKSLDIINKIFDKDLTKVNSHTINYGHIIYENTIVDEVMVSVFRAPRTYTCENMVEIATHGSLIIINKVISYIFQRRKNMSLIVQKFGGSSVADAQRVFNVAGIITDTYKKGNNVVVVVSAQGDTTDDLLAKAEEINPKASRREKDMLLAAGEQISIALLAMAIEKLGYHAVSLLGWQAGFETNSSYGSARIRKVNTERLQSEIDKRKIIIVAGFQGLNKYDDITTLGRGGSDTSAVAIAAAMHADRCQIFTDVEGVYTADPRKVETARKLGIHGVVFENYEQASAEVKMICEE